MAGVIGSLTCFNGEPLLDLILWIRGLYASQYRERGAVAWIRKAEANVHVARR